MKENNYPIISPLGMQFTNDIIDIKDITNKKPKKFERIIISYNFKRNNYYIDNSELEGYEHKEFLLNTLYNFNNQPLFKYDSTYTPTCCESFLFFIPATIIILIIIYLLYILIILCTFNPLIIYISYLCLKIVSNMIKGFKNNLNEKFKKKAINKIIKDTNNSEYCQAHHIQFKLGLSGYWLELEKIIIGDSELKKYIIE